MAPPPGAGHANLQGRRGGSGAGILRCAVITALALIVAAGLAVLIVWFVVRPAPLEYVVDDARVRGFNITAGRLNATFDLSIWAENRNSKVAVYYDSMEVWVVYDDQGVARGEVAPFLHPHHNATEIRVTAVALPAQLGESAAKEMNRERAAGKVAVRVEVRARIRFKIAGVKSKHYELRASCSPVDVYISPSRPSGRTECVVDF